MKKILICIDDTDDLESIGTGELLEDLSAALEERGLARSGFVTRHQLLISDKIAYTSHNSSMCTRAETDDLEEVIAFAGEYLAQNCAPGSDPGLCVLDMDGGADEEVLMAFGKRAQTEVLTKSDAYEAAKLAGGAVCLSEHGGTGDGVIGALAGVGLRLTGNDGKIKGKLFPRTPGEVLTVAEACRVYGAGQVVSADGVRVGDEELLRFDSVTKAHFRNGMVTLIADRVEGFWVPQPKRMKEKRRDRG